MYYLLKRVDEKQCTEGERVMVLADVRGVPAGTKGTVQEVRDEAILVRWDRFAIETMESVQIGQKQAYGGGDEEFSRGELEMLAFGTEQHPDIKRVVKLKVKHG